MKTPKRIEPLVEDGLVDEVIRPLMSGKEAAVYVVRCGEELRCAKVYKEANKRGFRQAAEYQEGRKVRNTRDARAMAKGSRHGREELEDSWQHAEVSALYRLAEAGVLDDTLVIFTADHGDFLGDHWLGEKEFLLEQAVGVPLIVRDPRAAADVTRGTVDDRLAETIDALPTFLQALGLPGAEHRLEGRSLIPLLHGEHPDWRRYAISEYDYAFQAPARERLGQPIDRCRMTMVRSERWKYLAYDGFRPQLFDLLNDPQELRDLGDDPAYAAVREEHAGYLFEWVRGLKRRTTISHQEIDLRGQRFRYGEPETEKVVQIGVW